MKKAAIIVMVCVWSACVSAATSQTSADSICAKLKADSLNKVLLSQLKASIGAEANPDVKCRMGVIYCLGCWATQNAKEAETIRAYLLKTFPGNADLAVLSNESIAEACSACESGKVNVDCTACAGSGNSSELRRL